MKAPVAVLSFALAGSLLAGCSGLPAPVEVVKVQHELDRGSHVDPDQLSAHWAAVVMVCCAQLIILPTVRELYTGFLFRRMGGLPGVPDE